MKENKSSAVRWGILAPGGIAKAFAGELGKVDGAVIQAVASRSLDRAREFASEYGIPHAYGDYGELAADPNVDIVYVASPHSHHREHTLLCLNAGKAVLCEKAFAMSAVQAEEMVQTAREKKLFLMEAMWTRFLPTTVRVRTWVADGRVGDVKLVKADFGFRLPWQPEHRLLKKEIGGGTLLDAGIYPTSYCSMIYGHQPKRIESAARIGETGVDEWFTAIFDYGDGQMASVTDAVRLPIRTEALIVGTEGKIEIPSFLSAKEATLTRVDGEVEQYRDTSPGRGMRHEAIEAMRRMAAGEIESPIMPHDESIEILRTLDALRAQWGLTYDE